MQWDKNNLLNFGVGCWKSEFWLYICIVEVIKRHTGIDTEPQTLGNYTEQAADIASTKNNGGFSFLPHSGFCYKFVTKNENQNSLQICNVFYYYLE